MITPMVGADPRAGSLWSLHFGHPFATLAIKVSTVLVGEYLRGLFQTHLFFSHNANIKYENLVYMIFSLG